MGVARLRTTVPNCAAGQVVTTPVCRFCATGLPPVTPNGPNLVNAVRACAPTPVGKHEANVTRPTGVGVRPELENGVLVLRISWLKPPARKNLFLTHGP